MDIDSLENIFGDYDENEAEQRREEQLLADEQPLDFEGADDCGDACKI